MHVLNTAPRPVARTQALSADAELPVLGLDLVAEHEQATSEMLALLDRTPSTLHGMLCDGVQPALVSDTRHGEPAALVATLVAAHEHPPEPVPRSSAMYSLSVSKAGSNKSAPRTCTPVSDDNR
eukprot:jgi/Chrpa1/876/Chrysochromulina_OHIO_Genome00002215-RA